MSTPKFPILHILKQMRSTNPGRYLIFFLVKFPVECRQNHVWGPSGAQVTSIFIKTYIFVKVRAREGKRREGKEGKGREGREGKEREGKGREGREGKGREGKGREGRERKGREGMEGKGTLRRTNTQ